MGDFPFQTFYTNIFYCHTRKSAVTRTTAARPQHPGEQADATERKQDTRSQPAGQLI